MTTHTIIILVIIGILSGILSGFVGVGGGIIIVPALIYVLGQSQLEAQGTSLFVLLLPVGALAVLNYWKAGSINWKFGIIVAVGFVVGGYVGSKLALRISPALVRFIFGIIMLYVSFRLVISGYKSLSDEL